MTEMVKLSKKKKILRFIPFTYFLILLMFFFKAPAFTMLFLSFDLTFYLGIAMVLVAFFGSFIIKNKYSSLVQRILFSLKSGLIVFMCSSIILISLPFIGIRTLPKGYWLTARILLNINEIKKWANELPSDEISYEPISYSKLPFSLKIMSFKYGKVYVHKDFRSVTLSNGGALVGHWGAFIANTKDLDSALKGSNILSKTHTKFLENIGDGAWFWISEY